MISSYAQNFLNSSTYAHQEPLLDGFIAIYNGLTSHGWVENPRGVKVADIATEPEIDDGFIWYPNITIKTFIEQGYQPLH